MALYETIYIIHPELNEDDVEGHIQRVAPLVTRLTELGFRLSAQTRDAVLELAKDRKSVV